MLKSPFWRIFYNVVIISALAVASSEAKAETTLKLGIVPQFDSRVIERTWGPIITDIRRESGINLIIVGSPSIPAFEQAFQRGIFDVAYMNPYHYVVAHRTQGYVAIVRDGARQLHGVLVVARNGPIKTLQDLRGKTIAFPAPDALGASLLMRATLTRQFHLQFIPSYVGDHTSAYMNAALGLTAAAGGVMATLRHTNSALRARLRIIYKTIGVPPHPIAVHPRIPAAIRRKLRATLLRLAATPQGAALFAKIPMKHPVAATDADYNVVRALKLDQFVGK